MSAKGKKERTIYLELLTEDAVDKSSKCSKRSKLRLMWNGDKGDRANEIVQSLPAPNIDIIIFLIFFYFNERDTSEIHCSCLPASTQVNSRRS